MNSTAPDKKSFDYTLCPELKTSELSAGVKQLIALTAFNIVTDTTAKFIGGDARSYQDHAKAARHQEDLSFLKMALSGAPEISYDNALILVKAQIAFYVLEPFALSRDSREEEKFTRRKETLPAATTVKPRPPIKKRNPLEPDGESTER